MDEAYLYLAVVNAVSTLTAMYGLIVLYRTSRVFLNKQSITQKFVVLQLVLVIHNLQGFIFVALAKFHLPPCSGRLSSSVRLNGGWKGGAVRVGGRGQVVRVVMEGGRW